MKASKQDILTIHLGIKAFNPPDVFVAVTIGLDVDAPGGTNRVVDVTVLETAEKLIVVYDEFELGVAVAGREAGT